MTIQNNNVPALRFPEFSDKWKERTLGEIIISITNGISLDQNSDETGFKVTRIETISDRTINLKKVGYVETKQDISRYKLQIGDILFSNINSVSHIGKLAYVDKDYDLYHGMNLLNIRIDKNKYSSRYFFLLLGSIKLKQYYERICNQAVSQASINQTDLKKTKLLSPTLPEQQKIAAFLTAVDEKIQQLTKKKDLLEQYKKGVMQKIFNQEIRFKDDNGNDFADWEEKILGNMIDLVVDNRGKTPPVLATGFPLLEVNSVGKRNINYNVVKKFVDENTLNTWFRKSLKKGDILFSTVGNTALCSIYEGETKAGIAQNLVGLRFEREHYLFMYYLITEKRNNHKFKEIEMSAVQPSVKVSQMVDLNFLVPTLKEQQKIAAFLSAIDDKINLVNQQLEKTKEYKKGLLQQMFV